MSLKSKENEYILRVLQNFINKKHYLPKFFVPYNCRDLSDGFAPSLATTCGTPGHIGNALVLSIEECNEKA